ncbi:MULTISPECIES: YihY/virulence factor BrkB family protein [unclassified Chryseobacterium]|uniref:YihY/virulence factor BrkB family protein n=1 Tax=unclassified Chryseobacterium TaxID=2593645 RepID=UPI0022699191|nr:MULTISPECIES: YihY/virulence factor BrkB family protein [unclassified Chryseobacterium]
MRIKIPGFVIKVQKFFDDIHIPVLGISLWQMFQIYITGIFKGKIGRKAGSISWSFTLSLFPFLLFLLSVLPYMPHYDKLQFYIFEVLIHNVFPANMETEVRGYIQNNIIPNMKGISNLTIIIALVFATNGTFSLINGFNENSEEKLSDVKEFILSFFITIGFITIVFLALFGVYYSEVVLKLFTPNYDISWLVDNLSKIIGFVSFPLFYFILLALFYWLGTVKIARFRQAVPGAVLTTVLFVVTTYGFAIYVKNIARYNVLYGSIGSMILLMVWVNVNVYLLLFGNELNMAIRKLRIEKLLSDEIKREESNGEIEPDFEK